MKRKYAPSKIVPVRFHKEELQLLHKKRKKMKVSDYIRSKVLDLTTK